MADQLAPRWLEPAHTPHLDALAARGTVFAHAYCNSPICAPSRASMCTGRHVSEIGAYDNGADFPIGTPTFMNGLADSDYEVWLSGKMHFIGPEQHHGFQRRLTTEIYPSTHVWTPDWNESPVHNPGTAVDQLQTAGLCTWNLQLDYDEEVHFRALEALRELARHREEPDAPPFLLCASYTHPHDPFTTTQQWWDLYDHDAIPMPSAPAEPLAEMHPYNQWLQIHHMIDEYPPREEHIRNARHAYLGMISYFDHQVGTLVAELERLGLADNTVVVVTSDHGEMLGEHGMWFKRTFFEDSIRVPLIFAGPGISAGNSVGEEVSLLDLFPTFLDLAGASADQPHFLPLPPGMGAKTRGASLTPFLRGDADAGGRRGVLTEYFSEGVCQPMRAAIQHRLKYVHVHEEPELLFDLETDAHETVNRIEDPAYADRLQSLKTIVHENYDPAAMREAILASQQRRRRLHRLTTETGAASWDVQPDIDPATQYVRTQDAQATNAARRFPRR